MHLINTPKYVKSIFLVLLHIKELLHYQLEQRLDYLHHLLHIYIMGLIGNNFPKCVLTNSPLIQIGHTHNALQMDKNLLFLKSKLFSIPRRS